MDDFLAFEIQSGANSYKIYSSGRVEGFPPDALITNHLILKLDVMLGAMLVERSRQWGKLKSSGGEKG